VESCTAVVEHFDGQLEIVRWIGREPWTDGLDSTTLPIRAAMEEPFVRESAAGRLALPFAWLTGLR
jgi:hypothetical protein